MTDIRPCVGTVKQPNIYVRDKYSIGSRQSQKMPIPVTETESTYSECRDISKPFVIQDAEMCSEVNY